MARVIIYERGSQFIDPPAGPVNTEYASRDLNLTWKFGRGKLEVWEGTANLDYAAQPFPFSRAMRDMPEDMVERHKASHKEREESKVARNVRAGPPLTPEQATTLVNLARLRRELEDATHAAPTLFPRQAW